MIGADQLQVCKVLRILMQENGSARRIERRIIQMDNNALPKCDVVGCRYSSYRGLRLFLDHGADSSSFETASAGADWCAAHNTWLLERFAQMVTRQNSNGTLEAPVRSDVADLQS